MLVPSLVDRVLAGETITIEGDPGLHINPIYVDDVVRTFEPALAQTDHGLFNVAGNEAISVTELVSLIGHASGVAPDVVHTATVTTGDLLGHNGRMRTTLGIEPEIALREGLRRTVEARRAIG